MIIGTVPIANRVLDVIYNLNKNITSKLLLAVEKDLCTQGKTKRHVDIAIYNSILVYMALIYVDVNTNSLSVRDEDYFKCKYNWTIMVKYYKCLNYNLDFLAESIDLFTKQPADNITVLCY